MILANNSKIWILLLLCGLGFLMTSEVNGQRGVVQQAPTKEALIFQPDEAQIKTFLKELQTSLTCEQAFEELYPYFFMDEKECKEYIYELKGQNYPDVNVHAAPMFLRMSTDVRTYLQDLYGDIKGLELVKTNTRYGSTDAMKLIILKVNFDREDGGYQSAKLALVDTEKGYKVLNLDN